MRKMVWFMRKMAYEEGRYGSWNGRCKSHFKKRKQVFVFILQHTPFLNQWWHEESNILLKEQPFSRTMDITLNDKMQRYCLNMVWPQLSDDGRGPS